MSYNFNEDWFSQNRDAFHLFLSVFQGRECRLLEIGSYEGRSAVWMLENIMRHENSYLVCIDTEERPNLRTNLEATGRMRQVDLRIGYSKDVLKTLAPNSFDFIYIDGCHNQVEVLEDAVLSFRLAKVGALICFDDYQLDSPEYGTPKISIDTFFKIYKNKLCLLGTSWSIWFQKTAD